MSLGEVSMLFHSKCWLYLQAHSVSMKSLDPDFFCFIIFYAVSGGALQIGKGIGKGIATGDGKAVVEGLSKGATSVGGGIAQGAESAVMGTADGLLSAGKGIFSGFKNVGQGIGGAIRGKKPSHFQRKIQDEDKK